MRLSTDTDRDEERAIATIQAALDAGVTAFDTARAYGLDESEHGHNERLLARAIASRRSPASPAWVAAPSGVRRITKCGMRRHGTRWETDGRARAIVADAHQSIDALGGGAIDLLLLHAPDPRVPLATSLRALARLRDEGVARDVGVSNVSRAQLEEAASIVRIAAVQVALGAFDDVAIRGGVAQWCCERGIELLAYAPLGGPERARRLARDPVLAGIAAQRPGRAGRARAAPPSFSRTFSP
jgi:aryl-alcohol dehydrogenase-like predicted oxidoreductase